MKYDDNLEKKVNMYCQKELPNYIFNFFLLGLSQTNPLYRRAGVKGKLERKNKWKKFNCKTRSKKHAVRVCNVLTYRPGRLQAYKNLAQH